MEKNKLTAEQVRFLFECVANEFNENVHLRKGQKCMIILWDIAPELYTEITGTDDDPFYVDERMDNFIKRISP
jgi:hypothetical protein